VPLVGSVNNQNHGFTWTIPEKLKDGLVHPLYVYAIDSGGGLNALIDNSPRTIECSPPVAAPEVTVTQIIEPDYCEFDPSITVQWNYTGGSDQQFYQIEIYDDRNYRIGDLVFDTGQVRSSTNTAPDVGLGELAFNQEYYGRVRVWDSEDPPNVSEWATFSWSTPLEVPKPNFTWEPEQIVKGEEIQFIDLSSPTPTNWFWSFGDGESSTEQNPIHVYEKDGNMPIQLTVDNGGKACSTIKNVGVREKPPIWKEILPNFLFSNSLFDFEIGNKALK
jgi:hypothetical protein